MAREKIGGLTGKVVLAEAVMGTAGFTERRRGGRTFELSMASISDFARCLARASPS
jgi:hypothetical protein